jgi:hypothetical protein
MNEAAARRFLAHNIALIAQSLLETVALAEERTADSDRAYFYDRIVRAVEALKNANERRAELDALNFPPAAAVIENGKTLEAARAEILGALSDFSFVAGYTARREIAAEVDLARGHPQGSP